MIIFCRVSLSYPFTDGEIYNKEAQNIVNTADLVIKAEHSYMKNTGMFGSLQDLETSDPPYLSPMPFNTRKWMGLERQCIDRILMTSVISICVDPSGGTEDTVFPSSLSGSGIVKEEISEGITGKRDSITAAGNIKYIRVNLSAAPVPKPAGINISPSPDGGISYAGKASSYGSTSVISSILKNIFSILTGLLSAF